MSYTKGPWEFHAGYSKHVFEIYGPKREAVCATHNWLKSDPVEESTANAHLISAAPDLYEALKEANEQIIEMCGAFRIPRPETSLDRCMAAIKKAEGKTE